MPQAPFQGLKVIDTTQVLAGPYTGYQFAVLGADVIKVENPHDPDFVRSVGTDAALNDIGMGTQFLTQNSNKRFLALDLKTQEGRNILKRLVADADVFIQNYRPGSFDDLGIGYKDLSAINPRLIYCSISAFGQTGPKASYTGYENVIQAASGYMSANGTPEVRPLRQGAPAVDYATGITAAFAITAALQQRERTGTGDHVDVAMTDVAMILMACQVTSHFNDGFEPVPTGNTMPLATSSVYPTKDGLLMIGACNAHQMKSLWTLLGRPDMIKPDHYNSPVADHDNEAAVLRELMLEKGASEWEVLLQTNRVPAARVRERLGDAIADPQFDHRQVFSNNITVPGLDQSVRVPLVGFKFADGGATIQSPPGGVGVDTDAVLAELGYSAQEISGFRLAGVVGGQASDEHHSAVSPARQDPTSVSALAASTITSEKERQ